MYNYQGTEYNSKSYSINLLEVIIQAYKFHKSYYFCIMNILNYNFSKIELGYSKMFQNLYIFFHMFKYILLQDHNHQGINCKLIHQMCKQHSPQDIISIKTKLNHSRIQNCIQEKLHIDQFTNPLCSHPYRCNKLLSYFQKYQKYRNHNMHNLNLDMKCNCLNYLSSFDSSLQDIKDNLYQKNILNNFLSNL